jgi:hypothetical protein
MIRVLSITQQLQTPPVADVTYRDAHFAFEYFREKCGQKGWLIEESATAHGIVAVRIHGATAAELRGIFERDAGNFVVDPSA